jgi:hypothetical protein
MVQSLQQTPNSICSAAQEAGAAGFDAIAVVVACARHNQVQLNNKLLGNAAAAAAAG